jgi:hypothetical protein
VPRRHDKVTNDDRVDWRESWRLFPGDVAYVWHAGVFAASTASQLEDSGFEIRSQIIWRKPTFAISRGHYHWQHEPCWYAVRQGASAGWIGDRSQTTVWDVLGRSETKTDHRGDGCGGWNRTPNLSETRDPETRASTAFSRCPGPSVVPSVAKVWQMGGRAERSSWPQAQIATSCLPTVPPEDPCQPDAGPAAR